MDRAQQMRLLGGLSVRMFMCMMYGTTQAAFLSRNEF